MSGHALVPAAPDFLARKANVDSGVLASDLIHKVVKKQRTFDLLA